MKGCFNVLKETAGSSASRLVSSSKVKNNWVFSSKIDVGCHTSLWVIQPPPASFQFFFSCLQLCVWLYQSLKKGAQTTGFFPIFVLYWLFVTGLSREFLLNLWRDTVESTIIFIQASCCNHYEGIGVILSVKAFDGGCGMFQFGSVPALTPGY